MTGTEFLIKECDEKFLNEDLNEQGQRFTAFYYESNKYFEDYEADKIARLGPDSVEPKRIKYKKFAR